jgi:hypothetical protein
VDPDYNARFLERCRDLGLSHNDYALNHMLYDIRKSGKSMLPPTTRRTEFRDYDAYSFAAEIAVRVLQRSEGISLDRILCSPPLRRRFDETAERLAPDESALKLRWAALNLRKTHRLKQADMSMPLFELGVRVPVAALRLDKLPASPAAYAFFDQERPVFAGETSDLKSRLDRHLRHSANFGLPTWLGLCTRNGLLLRYALLPEARQADRLAWLRQFINSERPLLNYQRAA